MIIGFLPRDEIKPDFLYIFQFVGEHIWSDAFREAGEWSREEGHHAAGRGPRKMVEASGFTLLALEGIRP